MDEFFQINEISNKYLESLKKYNRFSEETRLQKVKYLSDLKKRLKNILKTNKDLQNEAVIKKGTEICGKINQSLTLLNENEQLGISRTALESGVEESKVEEAGTIEKEEEEEVEEEDRVEGEKEELEEEYQEEEMANIIETIKTISSLIPSYDGSNDNLSSFISALKAGKTILTNDNTVAAVQVVLSKLSGKARAAVGENPRNFDEIINELEAKCTSKTSPDVFVAKLQDLKQIGDINKFTDSVEKLTQQLERAYIAEKIPVDTAQKMAIKQGVKALYTGVKNPETKILLKAAEFKTLSAAIEKTVENEKSSSNANHSQLMFVQRGQVHRGHIRGDRSFFDRGHYRGNRGNYRGNFRGNSRGNFQGRYQNRGHSANFYSSRGRRPYRGHSQSRIYYTNSESGQTPQLPQQATNAPQPTTQHQNTQQPQNFLGQIQRFSQ